MGTAARRDSGSGKVSKTTKDPTPEPSPEPTQPPPPTNVIAALAAVMRDLPGIGKDMTSGEGGGSGPKYNYRGIEQITAQAQKLFGRHGVVFIPRVEDVEVKDLVVNGKPWTQHELMVVYRVFGPGGVDDFIEVGPILGLGRDNSDKGANKAMTQAYKYALIQTLTIGDSKDDAERETHTNDGPPHDDRDVQDPDEPGPVRAVRLAWNDASREVQTALKEWWGASDLPRNSWPGGCLQSVTKDTAPAVIAALVSLADGERPEPYGVKPPANPAPDPAPEVRPGGTLPIDDDGIIDVEVVEDAVQEAFPGSEDVTP